EDEGVVLVEVRLDQVPLLVAALRAVVRHFVERLAPLVVRLERGDRALGTVAVAADFQERVTAGARRKARLRRIVLRRWLRRDERRARTDDERDDQRARDHSAMITQDAIVLDARYRDRRAATIENDALRVVVLREGGHVAAIEHKASGANPL